MEFDVAGPVRITCARGLSPTLEEEVTALGFPVAGTHDTWVDTEASLGEAMRLNLHLRTAYHVLYRLRSFACEGPEDLYQGVRAHAWEEVVPADGYVSVATRGDAPGVRNTMFATLKVKDAIVDRIQAEAGRRPDSGPERDRAVVTLYWVGRRATLYLDTSGRKLSDRGYRRQPHEAPLRETLAAAVLLELGYTGDAPLVNPMCGSGTLAIEAGLIAARRAPGRDREHGFMHVLGYDAAAWRTLLAEARAAERAPPAPIVASDRSEKALRAARSNLAAAGLAEAVALERCDFAATPVPDGPGLVVLNPEYGKRLGDDALAQAYGRIGDFFKQRCPGKTGAVITGNLPLAKKIGLRTRRRVPLWNGALECRLLEYELYAGTRKRKGAEEEEGRPEGA